WLPRLPAVREWLAPGAPPKTKKPEWTLPPEVNPAGWWEAHRPEGFKNIAWHHKYPYLKLPRQHLARWIGEKTGHWDFHSYHERFNHPPTAFTQCVCGEPNEKGHF
ncbi:hypothetical protein QBC46DRAFT_237272, partial [Diplogelasinospora grovesii]